MTNPNIISFIEEFRKKMRVEWPFSGTEMTEEQKLAFTQHINKAAILENFFRTALETIDREAEARGRNEAVDYIDARCTAFISKENDVLLKMFPRVLEEARANIAALLDSN